MKNTNTNTIHQIHFRLLNWLTKLLNQISTKSKNNICT